LRFDVRVGNDEGTVTIHQAVGMLAGQLDWPVADAFAQLRVYAHATRQSLEDAAADVVRGAVRLHAPPEGSALEGWLVVDRGQPDAWPDAAPAAGRRTTPPVRAGGGRPYDPARSCTTYARPRHAPMRLLAEHRRPQSAGRRWVRAA
jgi:hypothetical protein